jgi:long-chain acyl-CoA synthetase
MNLGQLAEESLERLGERLTMIFEGEKHTNLKSLEKARVVQQALIELGLEPGDACAVCMTNHPAVLWSFQGIFRSGATAVPLMFQLSAPEIRFVLEDTKAAGVITDATLLFKIREAAKDLDHIKFIIVLGGKSDPDAAAPEYRFEELLDGEPAHVLPDVDDDSTALMLYTSGTTGKPKGVMLSHANLIAAAEAGSDAAEHHLWEGPRISVNVLPLAHMFGIGIMNTGYLAPKELEAYVVQLRWFEPESFMKHIQQYKATSTAAVPTMLSMILNHPKVDQYDLSSLKEIVVGAAPLPQELARAFMDKYGCSLREGYGMTESAAIGTINRTSWGYKPGSAGKALCNNKVAIVDENDEFLPAGQRGEIVLQGPMIMKGYHNRPEATAETLRNGWLHTGDIGYLDEEGWLFIVDRKKDMIIRGGENIYPAELEDVLYRHPAVAEAAVVGLPDPVYGERVVAFVVKKKGQEASAAEIIGFMKKNVTSFKCPEEVQFIDMLPKSGVGKILRRELRDKAVAAAGRKG